MQPEQKHDEPTLDQTIFVIGRTLAGLDPGALAELRRLSLEGDEPGAPYFWRLAARHDFPGGDRLRTWARIVQIMAILTDKGAPEGKRSPHEAASKENGWRGFGHALCDSSDTAWGIGAANPRPMLSEQRLARLLAAKGMMRNDLMERVVRALAANKPPGAGVNCIDIARLLLFPDNPDHARKIARDYYARLDRATRADTNTANTPATGVTA